MLPQQGIMSIAKPRANPRDSRAVDQVLSNTTQMLGKLDNKTLGLLLQLTQYIKANKPKYKELMAKLEAKGSLPPGVFPKNYDPQFLSVFALSVAKAQQAKGGMAAGGIAGIAQTMKNQGRGKDTMLAHISPEEAELLEKRGGVGTTNPVTGLPEYGIFEDIGNALSGVGNAVGSVLKPVGDLIGSVISSPLGLAATAAAAYYFMGPGAAVVPSVAEAALPGAAVAEIGTAAHLTPAAIEAGIGTAGYGTNAAAAESGLFDPATIGSGAAIGAPSTSDKLLAANLLKNTRLSVGEEEPASDPNALIKMLMMYEMMGSKQNQPTNIPLPELTEATSSLPYDTPKKKMSAFISQPTQPTQNAAGGGLMTKHLGIGGLSAKRSQTDYAKNYLPGSGYRPGQGGVTYFTPMEYTGGDTTTSTDTTGTSSSATDELLRQTLGRTGSGGRSQEERDQREADLDRMDDYLGMTMREYWNLSSDERKSVDAAAAERNPIRGGIVNAVKMIGYPMILRIIDALKNTKDTVQQTWANNRLKAMGIDPKIILANQNEIAGLSMQNALKSIGQDTTPSFTERSPEQMAGISMQRALESLGQNTTPLSSVDSGGYADSARYAGSQNDVINQLIADSNAAASASQNAEVAPSVGYTFQTNRFTAPIFNGQQDMLKNLGETPNAAVIKYLAENANIAPTRYEGVVSAEDLGSQFPGPSAQNEMDSVYAQIEAADAAERAEKAQIAAAEEKAYAERTAAKTADAVDTTYMREAFDTIKKDRDRLEKEIASKVDSDGRPLGPEQIAGLKSFVADKNKNLDEANAKGLLSPEASRDSYERERINILKKFKEGFPEGLEGDNQAQSVTDRYNTVVDRINKLDSPFADRFAPEMTTTGATQAERENIQNAINSLKPGSLLYAPVDYSNQFLTPEQYDKLRDPTDPFTNDYRTPYANYPEAPPVTEGEKLDQFVQALLSMEPTQPGKPIQLAALGDYNLGEDGASDNFAPTQFPDQMADPTAGVFGVPTQFPDLALATSDLGLATLAPTPYSYTGGQSLASIANSYGNEGSVWTDGGGNPWVGADGKFLLTSQGAAQNAFNESPAGQEAAMRAEVQSLQNRYPAPTGGDDGPTSGGPSGGGGRSSDGGDGGGYSGAPSGGDGVGRSPPGSAHDGQGGYGGNGDARGGYLQHGRFDQRMADGGIAALHQYNLGSYSDGGRLLKGPGDGVSDDIPATIGQGQPARLADGEFVIPARIVSELGNGSTDAGARKLYAMMDRIQKVRRKTKNVAANTKAAKYLPA